MLSGHFLGFFFGRDILHPLNVFLNSYRRQQYVGFRVILVLFLLLLCPVHEEGLAVLLCCSILKQNLWKVLVLPHRWTLKSNLKLAEESVWFYRLLVFWLEKLREKKQGAKKNSRDTFKKCHFWDFSPNLHLFFLHNFQISLDHSYIPVYISF